tara:strand:+ start:174 stop:305 length:132 start_codon:yes stop_codon:yes gene_type:complete
MLKKGLFLIFVLVLVSWGVDAENSTLSEDFNQDCVVDFDDFIC